VFLRRNKVTASSESSQYSIGEYQFQKGDYRLLHKPSGEETKLTKREADLLEEFARRQNKIVKRSDILIKLWGEDDYFKSRSLDVFVSRIRKYLSKDPSIELENIHGVGFRLNT
jgi:DNA-binding response OmpR family regulator